MLREKKILMTIVVLMGLMLLPGLYFTAVFFTEKNIWIGWKNTLSVLPSLIGVTGVIITLATKLKRNGMLRAFMCYNIFTFPFYVIRIKYTMESAGKYGRPAFPGWAVLTNIALPVLFFACCCIGLWILSRKRSPLLKHVTLGGELFSEFAPARSSLRFVNRLTDLIIIVYVIYIDIIENYYLRYALRGTGTGALALIEITMTLYYYIILEGIFNTSIGKCITSTMIVNEDGRRAGLGKAIGRTLCRFIPFEAFSFFGSSGRGWHDSISNTYVVKAVAETNIPATHLAEYREA